MYMVRAVSVYQHQRQLIKREGRHGKCVSKLILRGSEGGWSRERTVSCAFVQAGLNLWVRFE